MKLMESLPIVFVVLVAAAALALDDTPDYESVPKPQRPAALAPAVALPVEKTLSPNEALVSSETLEFPREAPKPRAASAGRESPKPKAASAGRKAPTPNVPMRDVTVHTAKADAPRSSHEAPRSRLDIEERRLAPDERIQHAVIDAIARQPNLTGKVGVEARDAVVMLSGWTMTPGQSLRAERAAARVEGVRQVVNQIRPRMGAITS